MQHKLKWIVPEKPVTMVPQRKRIVFLGTATKQSRMLDQKAKEDKAAPEEWSRVTWKGREDGGFGSVYLIMQLSYPPDPDSLVWEIITALVSVDLDDADAETDLIWTSGWC